MLFLSGTSYLIQIKSSCGFFSHLHFDATIVVSKEASELGLDKMLPLQNDFGVQFGNDLSRISETRLVPVV